MGTKPEGERIRTLNSRDKGEPEPERAETRPVFPKKDGTAMGTKLEGEGKSQCITTHDRSEYDKKSQDEISKNNLNQATKKCIDSESNHSNYESGRFRNESGKKIGTGWKKRV